LEKASILWDHQAFLAWGKISPTDNDISAKGSFSASTEVTRKLLCNKILGTDYGTRLKFGMINVDYSFYKHAQYH